MEPHQPQPTRHPHLHSLIPNFHSNTPHRTANSTPVSSPGLFSPSHSRANMAFNSQVASEGTTPAPSTQSPYLHPLHQGGHKVKETYTAMVDRDFMTGRKLINHYEVIEEIGRGQHGKVKLARNLNTNENVAIKIIPRLSKTRRLGKVSAYDPQQNTKREIAILKKIRHPNVVALLEVIDDPELRKIYMVLEHVELGEIVWRKKGLPFICRYERYRVDAETSGAGVPPEMEAWARAVERRQAIKDWKRAQSNKKIGESDPWSNELSGALDEDDLESLSQLSLREPSDFTDFRQPVDEAHQSGSRVNSRAPSRTQSAKSMSSANTPYTYDSDGPWYPNEDDMETPGALRSNPNSSSALAGTMYGAYLENPPDLKLRHRSPSMADSIISHMSSVHDLGATEHDAFTDDYSYVPCFTIDQARSTFLDTVLGLEYLHYHGVVHRDIKPANLLWTKDHRVKISDFGVSYFGRPIRDGELDDTSESEARDFDDDRELSKTVGTPAFFAPELCYTDVDREPPKVSEQIDVWSLGVTLYCLIFARIPFMAEDEFSMFRKIAKEEVYIPRRRLRPVDPFTDPTKTSLFKRVNREPYRDDDDLLYEDIDDDLHDLLKKMLIKNPDRRIRLREVKRHPWVVSGIDNLIAWIDDTDPSRKAAGRKIQVDDKEIGSAVVPLTFLERARSAVKKTLGKVMHPRGDRGESASRRRAASSAASSSGDVSSAQASPHGREYVRDIRRKSLKSDDYFATITQLPTEHPLSYSVVASPSEPDHPGVASMPNALSEPPSLAESPMTQASTERPLSAKRSYTRHVHAKSVNAFLSLTPPLREAATVPASPALEHPADVLASLARRPRELHSTADESTRTRSMDRAGLVFPNKDKRAEPMVGLNTASAAGNVQLPRSPRPVRSVDLGKHLDRPGFYAPMLQSPQSISPQGPSPFPYGQVKSEGNIFDKQRSPPELDERPKTAQRMEDIPEGKTPAQRVYNNSTPESFARAQEHNLRKRRQELEDEKKRARFDDQVQGLDPAQIPCPPSPGDDEDLLEEQQGPSRTRTTLTGISSSSTSFGAMSATPLTSPSELTSPSFITQPGTGHASAESIPAYRSDPSLPALMSGASSLSGDMEGDFLCDPGVVENKVSALDTTESLTPPALKEAEEHGAGFPLEQQELREVQEGAISLVADQVDSATSVGGSKAKSRGSRHFDLHDDDDDSDSDDGLLMKPRAKAAAPKETAPAADSLSKHLMARRRDTNTSIASVETARRDGD